MGKTYKTSYVIRTVGICANTLYNWFNGGKIPDVRKDKDGRRIFTEADIERLKAFKDQTIPPTPSK